MAGQQSKLKPRLLSKQAHGARKRFPNIDVYVYVCVYTCVYMCVNLYVCVHVYVFVYICLYMCSYTCVNILCSCVCRPGVCLRYRWSRIRRSSPCLVRPEGSSLLSFLPPFHCVFLNQALALEALMLLYCLTLWGHFRASLLILPHCYTSLLTFYNSIALIPLFLHHS